MRERVLKAAAEWIFVPPDAVDVVTDDYRAVVYGGRGPSVQWSSTVRPLDAVIAEVRALGQPVQWWVDDRTQPADTGEVLQSKGFREIEVVEVLARNLPGDLSPRLDVPDDVVVRPALDAAGIEAAAAVDSEVFGWAPPSRNELDHEIAAVARGERSPLRFVAEIDGEIVGAAGYTLLGDVVGLWGAAVLEKARGRGVYRALIAARCEAAVAAGANLALVRARTATSAPTLRRIGFVAYGTKRCYQL
ncbi:N-acetyltransferase [Kribbella antibiotica]|uniref:N-acetyltransferase n=1 Tax=Kribbella antibiotica TaxID=190195 RepID=A0A4R4ZJU2_9ACTN|nr:GNAT family N-acetyltransferase [Kribbella antibiotica]TDD58775.1 N-acetyltransferase [Kribbella antibiotica]